MAVTEESEAFGAVDSLVSGGPSASAVFMFSVEQALKDRDIDVSIDSVAASGGQLVEPTPNEGNNINPLPPPPPDDELEIKQVSKAESFGQLALAVMALLIFSP